MKKRFCAFCGSPLQVYRKKTSSAVNIILSGLLTLFFHLLLREHFDPRIFLFWIFFIAVGEIFIQLRWRLSIVCRACGFDPAIYLKNSQDAVRKVKTHLEIRRNSPEFALAPPLKLPHISRKRLQEIEQEIARIELKENKGRLALRI